MLFRSRRGHPHGDRPGRDVVDDDCVRADLRTLADPDRTQDLGPGPDDHVVAERRVPLAVTHRLDAQRRAVEQDDVVPDRDPRSCTYAQLEHPLTFSLGDIVPGLGPDNR